MRTIWICSTSRRGVDPYEANIPMVIPGSILLMPPSVGFSVGWLRL